MKNDKAKSKTDETITHGKVKGYTPENPAERIDASRVPNANRRSSRRTSVRVKHQDKK